MQTTEVETLSLEGVIEHKLVKNNLTDQVLVALKEKFGGMELKSIDDKESYLEIKAAARECGKVRNLAVKICKEGREDAVKVQKQWVATEKRVVARVLEVEEPLDAEIDKFDAEVERKVTEEKNRQEEAYINRQAVLNKMGATYQGGCFVLGEVEFEANLIKGSSQDVWEEAIIPKFQVEYEKIKAIEIAEQKKKDDAAAELKSQQEELAKQQSELKAQQDEMKRKQDEAVKAENDKLHKEEMKKQYDRSQLQTERFNQLYKYNPAGSAVDMVTLWALTEGDFQSILSEKKGEYETNETEKKRIAEEKRIADIEEAKGKAVQDERNRQAAADLKKAEELAQASDKIKYAALIASFNLDMPEMRSGQYRKKVAIIRQKIEEIFAL